jgi:hypothetical protein
LLKEVKICKGIPTASTYLNSIPWNPNQKPPPKLLTKIRTTKYTHQGANHKPPSKLLTKIRTTQCTHLVQKTPFEITYQDQNKTVNTSIYLQIAPTIEYYYYYYYNYSILEDAHMHNVTMHIVANRFDDEALHIAFCETFLAS